MDKMLLNKNDGTSEEVEIVMTFKLKEISDDNYVFYRNDLSLRIPAEKSLRLMGEGAKQDGITLVVSSTFRSYDYQKIVYERNVKQMGQEAADRESARPGTSQHQLGTAVDFGSITDEFAETKAGKVRNSR